MLPVATTFTRSAMFDSTSMAEMRSCHAAAAVEAAGRLGLYGGTTVGAVAAGAVVPTAGVAVSSEDWAAGLFGTGCETSRGAGAADLSAAAVAILAVGLAGAGCGTSRGATGFSAVALATPGAGLAVSAAETGGAGDFMEAGSSVDAAGDESSAAAVAAAAAAGAGADFDPVAFSIKFAAGCNLSSAASRSAWLRCQISRTAGNTW